MEQHLSADAFFVGEPLTIADIALFAYPHVAHDSGFDLTDYPSVRAWLDRAPARLNYESMPEPDVD
jgi:glutathione S-transferase